VDWPLQRLAVALLGTTRSVLSEAWLSDEAGCAGESEGIRWRQAGPLLFGVIELAEGDAPEGSSALQEATAEAYRRIFRLLDARQVPHLWRVWNYLADITVETAGLERYRQFNIGRQDAFLAYRRGATGDVPAACALGVAGGPLSIAFMAGVQAPRAVENPRQISAYNYPPEYGPRSPTFSRAVLVELAAQEILFISGTASIVGHRTVHAGDVVGQTRESLANIAAVVEAANRLARRPAFALSNLAYRVYIRHAADFPAVRAALLSLSAAAVDIVYVQADICRPDLLIEIEAYASLALVN
jgi:enamine deaminase RidA (YjgF/YER057c/UK114 family)